MATTSVSYIQYCTAEKVGDCIDTWLSDCISDDTVWKKLLPVVLAGYPPSADLMKAFVAAVKCAG